MSRPWEVVLGPPGTGKTTHLMGLVRDELAAGRVPAALAAVTFTRAGAKEIVSRAARDLGRQGLELEWARTIHSMAYRLLQVSRGTIMTKKHWKEFQKAHAYDLTDLDDSEVDEHRLEMPTRTEDDRLRHAYEWGRSRVLSVDGTLAAYDPPVLDRSFRLFVKRYEQFKADRGLRDFADLLEEGREHWGPGVQVAFIDEAQDLSPAQIRCVEHWFRDCERVVVVGDADQAVFEFSGANPDWITGLARQTRPTILGQSYRVPARPHALARAIITRDPERIDAVYAPRPALGAVETMGLRKALSGIDHGQRVFVLVRNRMFLREPADELLRRRLPYLVEGGGGPCPYRRSKLVAAVKTAVMLEESQVVRAGDLKRLLDFVPARGAEFLDRGAKTRVKAIPAEERIGLADHGTLGIHRLVQALRDQDVCAPLQKDVKQPEREYFTALLKTYGEIPKPTIILTTMHGSKGREADLVILRPDMAKATWKEYESAAGASAEDRVFYVAVTRTRDRLILVHPERQMRYRWPSYEEPEMPIPPPEPAPKPPPVPLTLDDLADLDLETTPAPEEPKRFEVIFVEAISKYLVRAFDDQWLDEAQAAHPDLVVYTPTDWQLLEELQLDPETWLLVHADRSVWTEQDGRKFSLTHALDLRVPGWQKRVQRIQIRARRA